LGVFWGDFFILSIGFGGQGVVFWVIWRVWRVFWGVLEGWRLKDLRAKCIGL